MMPEQRTESRGSHGLSAPPAFQTDEQRGGGRARPLQLKIGYQRVNQFLRQRQEALLVALAEDSHLRTAQLKVIQLKPEDFSRTQTIEQQETHQDKMANGVEAMRERFYFLG